MNERISFNGRPTIGFGIGDAASEKKQLESVFVPPLVGFLVGSIGGAVLGSLVEKGVGTAVGTIAGGVGGAAVGLVVGYHINHNIADLKASSDLPQMAPGQVWSAVGLVTPTVKPWESSSKQAVEDAIKVALSAIKLTPLDGFWSNDYTFTIAFTPQVNTTMTSGTELPLSSEWAERVTFSNITRAPANAT